MAQDTAPAAIVQLAHELETQFGWSQIHAEGVLIKAPYAPAARKRGYATDGTRDGYVLVVLSLPESHW